MALFIAVVDNTSEFVFAPKRVISNVSFLNFGGNILIGFVFFCAKLNEQIIQHKRKNIVWRILKKIEVLI